MPVIAQFMASQIGMPATHRSPVATTVSARYTRQMMRMASRFEG